MHGQVIFSTVEIKQDKSGCQELFIQNSLDMKLHFSSLLLQGITEHGIIHCLGHMQHHCSGK